jgi:hypothetical protein
MASDAAAWLSASFEISIFFDMADAIHINKKGEQS